MEVKILEEDMVDLQVAGMGEMLVVVLNGVVVAVADIQVQ